MEGTTLKSAIDVDLRQNIKKSSIKSTEISERTGILPGECKTIIFVFFNLYDPRLILTREIAISAILVRRYFCAPKTGQKVGNFDILAIMQLAPCNNRSMLDIVAKIDQFVTHLSDILI